MAKRSRTAAERAQQASRLRTRPARARLLAAARELAGAHGYESIKAGDIATAAGVSRETFYTHFADKRSCLAEATELRLGEIESRLRIATEEGESWAAPILESLERTLQERYGSQTTPRGRIIEAMLELASERGYASTRLVDVIKRAKVSYPSFYRHFASKEECFGAAVESLLSSLASELEAGLGADADQSSRLVDLARLLQADSAAARILALEADRLPFEEGNELSSAAAAFQRLLAGPDRGRTIPGGARSADTASAIGESSADARARLALSAGAFGELLRKAALTGALERLPAEVAALASDLFLPAGDRVPAGARRRPAPPRLRERSGGGPRRLSPVRAEASR